MWDEVTGQEEWDDIYNGGFKRLKRLRPKVSKDYREFQFDVLMANPPFAGDIKETRIINHYDLAKKANGKWETKVGRDILFIERNLDFLKPGGRMAIVLPQGRFNNSSDKNIRDFIAERCRILAVVGLHGNTFKPHTGTKTSVLLVQKWNDDPKVGALCPRQDDYNIFFATMQKSGKDNSGEKMYVKKSDGSGEFLLDDHGHLIIDHDLFNHEGKTQDGIAEAFIEFAKKENFSFFKLSPSVTPFDAVRYQKLMDGLEAVELLFSKAKFNNASFRFDAEFFQKGYLSIAKALNRSETQPLSQLVNKIDVGYVGSMVSEYDDSGILLLQTRNINEFFVNTEECQRITRKFHQKLNKSQIKKDDVLIARSGSFGKASIYLGSEIINSADIIIVESNKNKLNPFYLVGFLNSKFGTSQLFRFASGAVQGHVNLTILENLIIPNLKSNFQNLIESLIKCSYKILKNSKELYQQAEDLLLSELNLKDWQPTTETIAIKSFKESFLFSGRFDAEYYQPKYEDLLRKLDNCKIELLKDIVSIKKSIEPGSDAYQQDGLPFIRVSNLSKFGITSTEIHISHDLIENIESLKPKKDTILLSKDGSIGIAYKVDNNLEAITSGAILHLKIKKQISILPDYLTLVLNSIIVRLQAERDSGGSIIQHWRVSEIENIVIPVIDITIQENISQKIQMSFTTKKQSKQLLEIAKIGVERAIETDEETATIWINQQLERLGINLKTTT
jgi:type I restriction enzyme M protein